MSSYAPAPSHRLEFEPSFALTVVVVTFNSAQEIGACLDAIPVAVGDLSYQVLVVDNASTDGTVDLIRSRYPTTSVLELSENVGFAGANNVAVAQSSGRHVVLLNPDTIPDPESLRRMVLFMEEFPAAGVVAPKLVNPDGLDQGTARSFPTPLNAIFGRRSILTRLFPKNRWSRRYLIGVAKRGTEPVEVDWVSGACLMVSREALQSVGLLDDRYFMYWEDADWCRRIKNAGYQVYTLPGARVVHDEGAARGVSARQVWQFHRSAYRYSAKHILVGRGRPLRPFAAGALMGRAALILMTRGVRTALRRIG